MAKKKVQLKDKDNNTILPITVATSLEAIVDLLYPVGTYIATSNTSFNPNSSLKGTWVKDVEGRLLVSQNSGTFATVGATGGEEKHTLTEAEMPKHTHGVGSRDPLAHLMQSGGVISQQLLGSYTYSTYFTDEKGSGNSHNNLMPYIVVIYWHRTA